MEGRRDGTDMYVHDIPTAVEADAVLNDVWDISWEDYRMTTFKLAIEEPDFGKVDWRLGNSFKMAPPVWLGKKERV